MSKEMPKHGEFCWNELMTTNTAKAKEFYCGLLGWEANDIDMGEMVYTMFKKSDNDIAGMLETPKIEGQDIPPHWMSYIMVDDLNATVEKAGSLGAEIMVAEKLVGDFGKFAVVRDPSGAHIAFWQAMVSK